MRPANAVRAVTALAVVIGAMMLASGVPSALASAVRSCGDIPETSTHLAIWNVSSRGLHCPKTRRAALKLFHCPHRHCRAVGYRFTCHNLGHYEAVDLRCVARRGRVVVRFQTGV